MTAERLAEFMSGLGPGLYNISITPYVSEFVRPEGGAVVTLPGGRFVASIWKETLEECEHDD